MFALMEKRIQSEPQINVIWTGSPGDPLIKSLQTEIRPNALSLLSHSDDSIELHISNLLARATFYCLFNVACASGRVLVLWQLIAVFFPTSIC